MIRRAPQACKLQLQSLSDHVTVVSLFQALSITITAWLLQHFPPKEQQTIICAPIPSTGLYLALVSQMMWLSAWPRLGLNRILGHGRALDWARHGAKASLAYLWRQASLGQVQGWPGMRLLFVVHGDLGMPAQRQSKLQLSVALD